MPPGLFGKKLLTKSQGHLILCFSPPAARKEEVKRGHPAPRKGAAAPLTPAFAEHEIALTKSNHFLYSCCTLAIL
jgi:hypothetical protein